MDENRPSRSMHVSSLPGSFGGLFQPLCERNSLISVCYAENIGPSSATNRNLYFLRILGGFGTLRDQSRRFALLHLVSRFFVGLHLLPACPCNTDATWKGSVAAEIHIVKDAAVSRKQPCEQRIQICAESYLAAI